MSNGHFNTDSTVLEWEENIEMKVMGGQDRSRLETAIC